MRRRISASKTQNFRQSSKSNPLQSRKSRAKGWETDDRYPIMKGPRPPFPGNWGNKKEKRIKPFFELFKYKK